MKISLIGSSLFVCLFLPVKMGAQSQRETESLRKEVKSDFKIDSFVESIKEKNGRCYLVCCYKIKILPHSVKSRAAIGEFELHVKSTVINNLKGIYGRNQELDFIVYTGMKEEADRQIEKMEGKLFFLFQKKDDDGEWYVDAQDPRSVVTYSKEIDKIYSEYFEADEKRK